MRPKKDSADWYPHMIGKHKTRMMVMETTYGDKGYVAYHKLLEQLTTADGHYLDFNGRAAIYYCASIRAADMGMVDNIVNTMVELEIVDKDLWHLNRIVWVQDLVNSLYDLYTRRGRSLPQKPSFCPQKQKLRGVSAPRNPPTDEFLPPKSGKEEKSIVKKSKEEKARAILDDLIFVFKSPEFKESWLNWLAYKKEGWNFSYKTKKSHQAALDRVVKISKNEEPRAIHYINYAIQAGWAGVYPNKEYEADSANRSSGTKNNTNGHRDDSGF